ncbi:hypothetical protein ACHAPT_002271 [Fusarium lateritium]
MPDLVSLLDGLSSYPSVPVDYPIPVEDVGPITNWGFTIYRTYYGPSSDGNWNKLLATAKRQAEEELATWGDDEAAEKLKPLFRLDARSDESLLSGVDRRGLCQMYKDHTGGAPMPTTEPCVFLYADEDVLNQVGQGSFIVKAVDAEEAPSEDIPRPESFISIGQHRYWGWMRIETRQILELWGALDVVSAYLCFTCAKHQADLNHQVWERNDAD